MWTEITRPKYERKGMGYSSDLGGALVLRGHDVNSDL